MDVEEGGWFRVRGSEHDFFVVSLELPLYSSDEDDSIIIGLSTSSDMEEEDEALKKVMNVLPIKTYLKYLKGIHLYCL